MSLKKLEDDVDKEMRENYNMYVHEFVDVDEIPDYTNMPTSKVQYYFNDPNVNQPGQKVGITFTGLTPKAQLCTECFQIPCKCVEGRFYLGDDKGWITRPLSDEEIKIYAEVKQNRPTEINDDDDVMPELVNFDPHQFETSK